MPNIDPFGGAKLVLKTFVRNVNRTQWVSKQDRHQRGAALTVPRNTFASRATNLANSIRNRTAGAQHALFLHATVAVEDLAPAHMGIITPKPCRSGHAKHASKYKNLTHRNLRAEHLHIRTTVQSKQNHYRHYRRRRTHHLSNQVPPPSATFPKGENAPCS